MKIPFLIIVTTLVGCSSQKKEASVTSYHPENVVAEAKVTPAPNNDVRAVIAFERNKGDLKVITSATGLEPFSTHGFHIHEKGRCEGSFESAGGHLNPDKHPHSKPGKDQKHLGDLGNLVTDAFGNVSKEVVIKDVSEADLRTIVGKAVIIHDKADDYATQPSGNSGKRIGCGVIRNI